MRHVGELSDVTSAQVQQSRVEYRKASEALAPFKRILDVYTSQWFGNGDSGKRPRRSQTDSPAVAFLKSPKAENFINARDEKVLKEALSILPSDLRSVAETALRAAAEKRFFHWELEFPEVFYGARPGTTQAIERLEGAGFDAVIGNPPFIDKKHIVNYLRDLDFFCQQSGHFKTARGIYDVYMLFLEQAGRFCRMNGIVGLLTPIPWLTQTEGGVLRKSLLELGSISLIDFSSILHFLEALVKVVAVIVRRGAQSQTLKVWDNDVSKTLSINIINRLFSGQFRIDVPLEFIPILEKIHLNSVPLDTLYTPTFGLRACSKQAGEFDKNYFVRPKEECKNPVPYAEANDTRGLSLEWKGRWIDYQPKMMYSPRSPELFLGSKVLVPSLLSKRKIRAIYDDKGYFVDQSLVCISATYAVPELQKGIRRPPLQSIATQLNSVTISFYFAHVIVGEALGGGAIHATPGLVGSLPIFLQPMIDNATLENVDEVIWKICGLTNADRQVIIEWNDNLSG
jgi:hypothetical protein